MYYMYIGVLSYRRTLLLRFNRAPCMYMYMYVCVHELHTEECAVHVSLF